MATEGEEARWDASPWWQAQWKGPWKSQDWEKPPEEDIPSNDVSSEEKSTWNGSGSAWKGGWAGWDGWDGWGGWDKGWGWQGGWQKSGDGAWGSSWDREWSKPNWSSWWKPDEEADESRYEKWNPAIADREDWASPEVSNEAVEHVEDPPVHLHSAGEARLPSIPEQAAEEEKSPLEDAAPAPEPVKEPPRHPHENEEWYQKWLRRQRNQPNHVIEIGPPDAPAASSTSSNDSGAKASSSAPADPLEKRVCPDDGKIYTFEELKVAYASEYSEEDLKGYWRDAMAVAGAPSDAKKDDYKQEEWYQKWLRRQQNKNRQIIEIG